MDKLSAHLDRGWDLAQRGDAAGALRCAQFALEADPDSPEVHNLLGHASAMSGDPEEALEHYRRAIALDEAYFEAMLNAAELCIHPFGQWDDAIELCEDAADLAESPEELTDCVLLKVDALLAKGDRDAARTALDRIPDGPFETAEYSLLVGRARFEIGDIEGAKPLLRSAVERDEALADAHYYLALVHEEEDDSPGAARSFLRSRALDQLRPPPAWAPSPSAFGHLVGRSLEQLPSEVQAALDGAEVYVSDLPGAEIVVDGIDPRAPVVLEPRVVDGVASRAPRLFVYQRNIERIALSLDRLDDAIREAVTRELEAMATALGVEMEAAATASGVSEAAQTRAV